MTSGEGSKGLAGDRSFIWIGFCKSNKCACVACQVWIRLTYNKGVSKFWKTRTNNRDTTTYPVYVVLAGKDNVVLVGRDKDKGKDIDDLFYILSQLLK